MTKRFRTSCLGLLVAVVAASLAGCSMAWPASQMLPQASVVGARAPVPVSSVRVYREGETPERPIAQFARVAAHGNGYATRATLETTLVGQAAQLGADGVVMLGTEVTKDETVGAYSGGLMIANQIQRPHLYGIAFVWAKVRLGVNLAEDRSIDYVQRGSVAERAGIREGEKILSVDGQYIGADVLKWETAFYRYNPGDTAELEVLDRDGNKRVTKVTFTPPE